MKYLADENLGIQVPKYLRKQGFDIISIRESAPGVSDTDVLALARDQNRILITLDKDFGELVFKHKIIHTGVLLLRLRDESIENKKKVLFKVLNSKRKLYSKFTIISEKRKRNT